MYIDIVSCVKSKNRQTSCDICRFGAGGGGRTRTVSPPRDFELFAPHGTQTNSAPCGGRCRTPKSLANTTVFEAGMQKSSVSSAIFALFDLDGIFGFWRDIGGMLPTNRAQQHTQ